jgi:hypothetical protein
VEHNSTVAEKQEMVSTNMRYRADLWKRAKLAWAQGQAKNLQQICNEGLELRLAELEAQREASNG